MSGSDASVLRLSRAVALPGAWMDFDAMNRFVLRDRAGETPRQERVHR